MVIGQRLSEVQQGRRNSLDSPIRRRHDYDDENNSDDDDRCDNRVGIGGLRKQRRDLARFGRDQQSRSRTRRTSPPRTDESGFRENDFKGIEADGREKIPWYSWWPLATGILTCWIPSCFLSCCGGMKDRRIQAAWREKVTLCIIIFILCLMLAFITFGLSTIVCRPPVKPLYTLQMVEESQDENNRWFIIHGMIYNIPSKYKPYAHKKYDPYKMFAKKDISPYFPWTPNCFAAGVRKHLACKIPGTSLEHCHDPLILNFMEYLADLAFEWKDIEGTTRIVFNGEVLDAAVYLDQVSENDEVKPFGEYIDQVLRSSLGGDMTKAMAPLDVDMHKCLRQNLRAGVLEVKTLGCIITDVVLYVSLVAILSLVLAKFFLAAAFAFIMGRRLGRPSKIGKNKSEKIVDGIEGPNNQWRFDEIQRNRPTSSNMTLKTSRYSVAMNRPAYNTANPILGRLNHSSSAMSLGSKSVASLGTTVPSSPLTPIDPESPKILRYDSTNSINHMYSILLVTCYSEGEAGLRTTLDSLSETDYDDDQKLLFVIADGIITGAGNEKSTPDTLIEMMELAHDRFEGFHFDEDGRPELHSYLAIADGVKRLNMARVYAGFYRSREHLVPMILVVKCGGPTEVNAPKPGNRGKRDSQIILMSFLSKLLFDDRMTPLEYDIFLKIFRLTGIMPDQYEVVLMVDADTKVMPPALTKLTTVFRQDALVMGLCGETRIANKNASWVSRIQVFEYYISHHLSKAFESIFGGVTCLPGCFCSYRIKAPKNGGWIPILASPDIVDMYSENVTDTLHKKNLLLLGEDRYLTTLMLKTFPKRKLLFVPQAICKTIVPDEFRVLLSQRRRWINSTIHNLFELVLVPDLCGTFCCSMQFVVFMELVGTLVLPAAIVFTGVLITSTFISDPQWIPLFLLAAILGLPALLILFTTRKLMYVIWFVIYVLALPIWNFILPVYAFWHFDDFSWGQTRKIDGVVKGKDDHGKAEGMFDSSQVYMKRWHEFEHERLVKSERWLAAGGRYGTNTIVSVKPTLKEVQSVIVAESDVTSAAAEAVVINNNAFTEKEHFGTQF